MAYTKDTSLGVCPNYYPLGCHTQCFYSSAGNGFQSDTLAIHHHVVLLEYDKRMTPYYVAFLRGGGLATTYMPHKSK